MSLMMMLCNKKYIVLPFNQTGLQSINIKWSKLMMERHKKLVIKQMPSLFIVLDNQ